MYEHGMIAPVVALVIWSLIMLIWLYATRIPAMSKAKVKPGEATKSQMEALPSANVANNYNHLMEQPTLFYALAIAFLDLVWLLLQTLFLEQVLNLMQSKTVSFGYKK